DLKALLAAVMLALSPSHLIFSRQALDYICPIPFVLVWLAMLPSVINLASVRAAATAGLVLGLGLFSYIAAWVMMPVYAVLSIIAVSTRSRRGRFMMPVVAVTFALPFVILGLWLWNHPQMFEDTVARYGIYDAKHLGPFRGAKDFLNYNNIQERM